MDFGYYGVVLPMFLANIAVLLLGSHPIISNTVFWPDLRFVEKNLKKIWGKSEKKLKKVEKIFFHSGHSRPTPGSKFEDFFQDFFFFLTFWPVDRGFDIAGTCAFSAKHPEKAGENLKNRHFSKVFLGQMGPISGTFRGFQTTFAPFSTILGHVYPPQTSPGRGHTIMHRHTET